MPKPNTGTFSYPGGKTTIAPWIVDHFANHDIYVEPFGGAASVFMYKERSGTEVYNDLNEHCVTFFQAIKERPNELREWIRTTPYSRKLFNEWSEAFKSGNVPSDSVEHAGRFWFIQTASFGGKLPEEGGSFSVAKQPCKDAQYTATKWKRKAEQVEYLAERFRHVQIELQDYRKVVDRYDSDEALFYFDPPYVDVGDDYYHGEGFDHSEFGDVLECVSGKWVVSYDELPEWADKYHMVSRKRDWSMDEKRESGGSERLVMNYDPKRAPSFTGKAQSTFPIQPTADSEGDT